MQINLFAIYLWTQKMDEEIFNFHSYSKRKMQATAVAL